MHHLSKVVESKPEGHRTRGASRPAGRGRTNFLALVFAAVTVTTGACGDDGSDDVVDTSADAEATGGSGHDMTGGSEGEEHDCAAEDWETGEFPGDETTGEFPGGETSGEFPGDETTGDVPEGETTGDSGDESSSSGGGSEEPDAPEESLCTQTGGTESVGFCCGIVSEFPSTCVDGACGCAPENSHEVKICHCPAGQCYDPALGCIDNF